MVYYNIWSTYFDMVEGVVGDNVWQTAITEDGLKTVRQLLRKSATKSTAVSCHRNKTRQLTEVVWIVGNKRKFNEVANIIKSTSLTDNYVFVFDTFNHLCSKIC